ncbi:hypothetical protein B6I21_03100 [candidate division KSB1 bacterium 4572_119]|nr:MAG: hypothetical protein B6I21_03100 [candidate division KSB1 bacterium 4572_119]
MKEKLIVGIDFGGTKIKFGVVTESGEILGKEILIPTESHKPADEIANAFKQGINLAVKSANLNLDNIDGIGIGSPGPLDLDNGIILKTPNLPSMENFPLKQTIKDSFNLPVELNNDANCFVLGEAFFGAGKDKPIVCGVTLGTGFGCGIVIHHKLYTGATGTAAEVWNSPYADSHFEDYGSARTVVRMYEQKTGKKLESKQIFQLAEQNDQNAIDAFAEFGTNLGRILAIMVNILDPDVFIIGGSVANSWKYFHNELTGNLFSIINEYPRKHLKVFKASLGDNAGLLGAAALHF